MPPAIVRTIAGYTGTARELAEIAEINVMTMRRRIYQWTIGEMSEADVMCVGPLPGGSADTCASERLSRPRLSGKGWG